MDHPRWWQRCIVVVSQACSFDYEYVQLAERAILSVCMHAMPIYHVMVCVLLKWSKNMKCFDDSMFFIFSSQFLFLSEGVCLGRIDVGTLRALQHATPRRSKGRGENYSFDIMHGEMRHHDQSHPQSHAKKLTATMLYYSSIDEVRIILIRLRSHFLINEQNEHTESNHEKPGSRQRWGGGGSESTKNEKTNIWHMTMDNTEVRNNFIAWVTSSKKRRRVGEFHTRWTQYIQ